MESPSGIPLGNSPLCRSSVCPRSDQGVKTLRCRHATDRIRVHQHDLTIGMCANEMRVIFGPFARREVVRRLTGIAREFNFGVLGAGFQATAAAHAGTKWVGLLLIERRLPWPRPSIKSSHRPQSSNAVFRAHEIIFPAPRRDRVSRGISTTAAARLPRHFLKATDPPAEHAWRTRPLISMVHEPHTSSRQLASYAIGATARSAVVTGWVAIL